MKFVEIVALSWLIYVLELICHITINCFAIGSQFFTPNLVCSELWNKFMSGINF